jgi:hypothetical protein
LHVNDLDRATWWLAHIRDAAFKGHKHHDGSEDARLALDELGRRLAEVANMLLMIDQAVGDEASVDRIRASIAGALALLTMAESPIETIAEECRAARLMRTKLDCRAQDAAELSEAA